MDDYIVKKKKLESRKIKGTSKEVEVVSIIIAF